MDKIPNELRSMIVRLLRNYGDRTALSWAYPDWEQLIEREERLRSVTFNPGGSDGYKTKEFLALFRGGLIRRRQFLQEVDIEVVSPCCLAGIHVRWKGKEFPDAIRSLFEAVNEISERLADETDLPLTPIRLELWFVKDDDWDYPHGCRRHSDDEIRMAQRDRKELYFTLTDKGVPEVKGIDEFHFRNHGVRRLLDQSFLPAFIKTLVDLRVLRLEYEESIWWSRKQKDGWIEYIASCMGEISGTLPLEEIHLRLGRNSPPNEFISPKRNYMRTDAAEPATVVFRHLSTFSSLAVLRLSGQFCIPAAFFDNLGDASPFPALTHFHLDIGPDTADGDWFFIKDETEDAGAKAAEDPKWTSYVAQTEAGIFPDDPSSDSESASEDESYYAYMDVRDEDQEVKRNRTLPNDATMGRMLRGAAGAMAKMGKIEEFSVCLADNFYWGDCKRPFVPPFITRKFELHYVKKPKEKSGPMLTWKLGQKIDHWRPAEYVLQAWKTAAGEHSGLEMVFVE